MSPHSCYQAISGGGGFLPVPREACNEGYVTPRDRLITRDQTNYNPSL